MLRCISMSGNSSRSLGPWAPSARFALPLVWSIGACGGGSDPILDRAAALEGETSASPATAPATTGQAPPQPKPKPVQAPAPQPGAAAEPTPGTPADPAPGKPDEPAPGPAAGGAPGTLPSEGPQVVLRGTVAVTGWSGGAIRLDIFDGDQRAAAGGAGPKPSIVAVHEVTQPGPFSVEIPQSVGQVWVGGFADEDQDGRPSPTDPTGWYTGNPVSTATDQSGLALVFEPPPPPPPGSEE